MVFSVGGMLAGVMGGWRVSTIPGHAEPAVDL